MHGHWNVAKVVLIPLCILLMQIEATASEACDVHVEFLNRERRVPGPVNVECGITPHNDKGYGNWGVNSNMGSVENGDQFAGWKNKDGHRQWQSCTSENPPPDCEHYNTDACTTQVAYPYDEQDYASYVARYWNESCSAQFQGGIFIIRRAYMSILELDEPDEDDHITTIRYGDVSVPIECNGIWRCEGQSSWKSPESGNSAVTAQVSIRVWTRHHER